MTEEPWDETAYDRMLQAVTGAKEHQQVRRSAAKVSTNDLLNSITSTRKLKETKVEDSKVKAKLGKISKKKSATLVPPIHRLQRQRIQGEIGFNQLKKDLQLWKPIVDEHRISDHIQFPLEEKEILRTVTTTDRAEAFKPKTELEIEMAKVLQGSKFNLTNDTEYTEAELEIIQAMDAKEAKAKLQQLRKTRALLFFAQAKNQRQKRIKSKKYHRILQREERRTLLKEFDDLLSRDPEAAKEKLKELEAKRIKERITLKHTAHNSYIHRLRQFVRTDKRAQTLMQDHLKLGRELREKAGKESDTSDDEPEDVEMSEDEEIEKRKKTLSEILKESAEEAANAMAEASMTPEELQAKKMEAKLTIVQMREEKRKRLEEARLKAAGIQPSKEFDESADWSRESDKEEEEEPKEPEPTVTVIKGAPKKTKKAKKRKDSENNKDEEEQVAERDEKKIILNDGTRDIDEMFDHVEDEFTKKLQHEAALVRAWENVEQEETLLAQGKAASSEKKKKNAASGQGGAGSSGSGTSTGKGTGKGSAQNNEEEEEVIDPQLDPAHFLQVETTNLAHVSKELDSKMDEFEHDNQTTMAEAFKDDDVVGEFDAEKGQIEESEKEKDIDLNLMGWGSWTGPGIDNSKKKDRLIIKANQKKRKDNRKRGVIMHEKVDEGIRHLLPKTVPYPYLRLSDYETALRQPVGRDWNAQTAHRNLVKPKIATMGGRVIRPIDKRDVLENTKTFENDEE